MAEKPQERKVYEFSDPIKFKQGKVDGKMMLLVPNRKVTIDTPQVEIISMKPPKVIEEPRSFEQKNCRVTVKITTHASEGAGTLEKLLAKSGKEFVEKITKIQNEMHEDYCKMQEKNPKTYDELPPFPKDPSDQKKTETKATLFRDKDDPTVWFLSAKMISIPSVDNKKDPFYVAYEKEKPTGGLPVDEKPRLVKAKITKLEKIGNKYQKVNIPYVENLDFRGHLAKLTLSISGFNISAGKNAIKVDITHLEVRNPYSTGHQIQDNEDDKEIDEIMRKRAKTEEEEQSENYEEGGGDDYGEAEGNDQEYQEP